MGLTGKFMVQKSLFSSINDRKNVNIFYYTIIFQKCLYNKKKHYTHPRIEKYLQ